MTFGLTADGFVIKPADTIKTEIEDDYKNAFGDDIDLQPDSIQGLDVGILSERFSLIWELAEAVYNASWVNTAVGSQLDQVAALIGKSRLPELRSQCVVTLGTAAGPVLVPAGSIVSQSATGTQWQTLVDANIPAGAPGTVDVTVEAINPGAFTASIGSIDTIDTPVTGWDSVTNAADETLIGRLQETDADFRLRLEREKSIATGGSLPAMISRVSAVDGVTFAGGRENRAAFTVAGLPPHSVEMIVEGGTDADVAAVIYDSKPAGIETEGDISETVVDALGQNQIMKFSRPTNVTIYLIVNLTVDAGLYPAGGDDDVKDALTDYGDTLTNGQDILNHELVAVIANADIPGILTVSVLQGTAPSPATSANISIAVDEKASILNANITVNS